MIRLHFSHLCILNSTIFLDSIRNVVFSILEIVDSIRNVIFSILEIVGIKLGHAAPPVEIRDSGWGNSIEAEHDQRSGLCNHCRSFGDEIRESLTVVTVDSVAQRFFCEKDAICAVCLCEYQKQDPVWLLPSCSHIFHKCCLDRWLDFVDRWLDQNRTSCPTCRSSVLTQELTQKRKGREEALTSELALWFSFYHGPAAMRSSLYGSHIDLSDRGF